MFAVIKTGGKQYKVAANDIIKVEKLLGSSGDMVEFSDVLMMGEGNSMKIGAPLLSQAKVFGTVLDQIRDDKVIIFKKNRRHNYRRKNGHRQYLTVVQIIDISADGTKPSPKKVAPKTEKVPPKTPAKETKPLKAEAPQPAVKKAAPVKKAASKTPAKAKAEQKTPKAKPAPKK